jgi:eukaryotic-like serine/threonine-protein kinase
MSGSIRLGEDFELDLRAYELRRSGRPIKLERIPMDLLLLLVEQRGQLVGREQIVNRIWGNSVFLDADNSINAAVRKLRQALRDDPEHPRFIQTVTGKGYRLIASVTDNEKPATAGSAPGIQENLVGRKVSHYRVLGLLGGGGMGLVYKAEDLRLGRTVAIKFLPGEHASDAAALDRLRNEARAASSLDHPNICSIYELDEHQGQPFIVMQLLDGQTLGEWIAGAADRVNPSCVREAVTLSIQICRGLEAAHEKGIIHRDIKPANIFVTKRGEAKILDFGVAKLLRPDEADSRRERDALPNGPAEKPAQADATASRTNESIGTPSYLSPEQIRHDTLDARTDLFSFGLVLYEMATGQRAFSGNTAAAIQEAVLRKEAQPARKVQPGVPPQLESVISKAMEKDRNLRYATAAQLRADLEDVAAVLGKPTTTISAGATETARAVSGPRRMSGTVLAGAAVVILGIVAGGLYYRTQLAKRLSETDTIVIADFSNSTGDPIFNDALKQGLDVALHQSPFLSIASDDKLTASLKLMTLPPDTPVTGAVAREACERMGSKAYIEGAIALLGSEYVLGLKAVNCRSGEVLAREQVTAATKEKVIPALGEATSRLRAQLGESLATVQRYDVRLEQATTSSLEALKAFSVARANAIRGQYADALPLYKHAIELDPNFAMAHARLGQAYANSGQSELSLESVRRAFELKDRTSELEKFYIVTRYYELVTGEVDKRIETLQLWKNMYPREPGPRNDLSAEYTDMGRYDEALPEAEQTTRLAPSWHTGYELLGQAYIGLNRFAEAKAVRQKEIDLKLDYHWDHIDLYGIAFLENDAAAMQREIQWSKGNKYEYLLLRSMAGRLASLGKLREAREMFAQARQKAEQAGFADSALSLGFELNLLEAMLGVPRSASAPSAFKSKNHSTLTTAGRLYACTGQPHNAEVVADGMVKDSPHDVYVNRVWVPTIRAEVELSRADPAKAIELLQAASPYEFGWKAQYWPSYLRGRAYLAEKRGKDAAIEFEKILGHQGVSLAGSLSPLVYSLSQLELARARALAGDVGGARQAYQDFFKLWKDADPDIPVLQQAKLEFGKL